MGYTDLREFMERLKEAGKLTVIDTPVNKDTHLMPIVRWQFRGLPEEQRKSFLFTNVFDAHNQQYSIPVLTGALAASREIYALGMNCQVTDIHHRWLAAQKNPLEPILVDRAPVQEEVHTGASLLEHGGLSEFPFPIATPGLDNAPYVTCAHWFTRDPETGTINVGNYRAQIKSPVRTGVCVSPKQHIGIIWDKYRRLKQPMPAALVIGTAPAISYTAVSKIPYGIGELSVAGGIAGRPVALVKCLTIDMEVPAHAEIVVEGFIPTDYMEPEAPFGEFTGYLGHRGLNPCFEVQAITHRTKPILLAIVSQFPPSESSKLRQIGYEAVYSKFLKEDCNIPTVLDVAFHETAGVAPYCVIRMKKTNAAQPWQALNAAVSLDGSTGKVIITVDEDIDPWDADSVNWALSFRMQPHLDTAVVKGKTGGLDPSSLPPDAWAKRRSPSQMSKTSAILIDATRKWGYPPVSLPKKEYMERAKVLWEELGLPSLQPKVPWHGYTLGYWTDEDEQEAQLAVKGEYFTTGTKFLERRIKVTED